MESTKEREKNTQENDFLKFGLPKGGALTN